MIYCMQCLYSRVFVHEYYYILCYYIIILRFCQVRSESVRTSVFMQTCQAYSVLQRAAGAVSAVHWEVLVPLHCESFIF